MKGGRDHPSSGDGQVDQEDLRTWVTDVKGTWYGDANLDGVFDSGDMVQVFQTGEYEDALAGNSTWPEGDWNADGDFDSSDLIIAYADGGFEQGRRREAVAVPEPLGIGPSGALLLLVCFIRRSRELLS